MVRLRCVGGCTVEKAHGFSLPYLLNVWWHRLGLDQIYELAIDSMKMPKSGNSTFYEKEPDQNDDGFVEVTMVIKLGITLLLKVILL